jgi:hypothetical protein
VNFRAFATRFVRTCSTRRRSPVATRSRGGSAVVSRTSRPIAIGSRPAATWPPASAIENGPSSRSIVPDSRRASSSRSPTSSVIDATIDRLRSRKSRSTAASATLPPRISSRYPPRPVSGVRSSWATVETKVERSASRAGARRAHARRRPGRSPGPGATPAWRAIAGGSRSATRRASPAGRTRTRGRHRPTRGSAGSRSATRDHRPGPGRPARPRDRGAGCRGGRRRRT